MYGARFVSLVLSREWGNGLLGLLNGTLRDYHRHPFPHSPLRTRESLLAGCVLGFQCGNGLRLVFGLGLQSRHPGVGCGQLLTVGSVGGGGGRGWDLGFMMLLAGSCS